MLVIHTPGHSPYTDTLIMYAIAYAAEDKLEEVVGRGLSYTLFIDGMTEVELAESLKVKFDGVKSEFEGRLARLVEERDVAAAQDALARVKDLAGYLASLAQPAHAQQEGRHGKGRLIKLPLMPSAGKYLREDLTKTRKYRVEEYKVCQYCAALALLGLGVGTVSVAARTTVVVSTVGFEGALEGQLVRQVLESLERLRQGQSDVMRRVRADEMPDRLIGNLLLTCFRDDLIASMESSNASWRAFVVRFDVERVVQIRGFSALELDSLLTALADLARIGQKEELSCMAYLTELLTRLLGLGAVSAIERLFDYLVLRSIPHLYGAVRDAYSSSEGRWSIGEGLVRCLAGLALEGSTAGEELEVEGS